jgi:hypothetical protein
MWPSFDLVRQTGYAVISAVADQPDRAIRKPVLRQKPTVPDDAQSSHQSAPAEPADRQ